MTVSPNCNKGRNVMGKAIVFPDSKLAAKDDLEI
jgi:hypothetical protein